MNDKQLYQEQLNELSLDELKLWAISEIAAREEAEKRKEAQRLQEEQELVTLIETKGRELLPAALRPFASFYRLVSSSHSEGPRHNAELSIQVPGCATILVLLYYNDTGNSGDFKIWLSNPRYQHHPYIILDWEVANAWDLEGVFIPQRRRIEQSMDLPEALATAARIGDRFAEVDEQARQKTAEYRLEEPKYEPIQEKKSYAEMLDEALRAMIKETMLEMRHEEDQV